MKIFKSLVTQQYEFQACLNNVGDILFKIKELLLLECGPGIRWMTNSLSLSLVLISQSILTEVKIHCLTSKIGYRKY